MGYPFFGHNNSREMLITITIKQLSKLIISDMVVIQRCQQLYDFQQGLLEDAGCRCLFKSSINNTCLFLLLFVDGTKSSSSHFVGQWNVCCILLCTWLCITKEYLVHESLMPKVFPFNFMSKGKMIKGLMSLERKIIPVSKMVGSKLID